MSIVNIKTIFLPTQKTQQQLKSKKKSNIEPIFLCLHTKKNTIKIVHPADGIKGKTWGPSTLHQRARGNLPALAQVSTQKPTHFSKSAPNLDKSRVAGNDSPTNASTSHTNFLGKSVDALNIIKSGKNNNNYGNSTKLEADDHSNTGQYMRHNEQTIDDDEDVATPGCFSFIGRNDDTIVKRKKHSLDSKMADTPMSSANLLPLRVAVKSIGAAAYAQNVNDDDDNENECGNGNIDDNTKGYDQFNNTDLNNVIYDRVFYRNIQKSLDDISIGCQQSQYQVEEPQYQFDRECFMVNPCDNDYDSSFDAGNSINQEMSQQSIDFSIDEKSFADELNSSSEITPISRKNSVTFRGEGDYPLLCDSLNDDVTLRKTKIMGHYEIISRVPSTNKSSSSNSNNLRHSILSNGQQKGAIPKVKKPYTTWNILGRKKTAKAEMDEQLLSDDSVSSKTFSQA